MFKKLTLLGLMVITLWSCSDEEIINESSVDTTADVQKLLTIEEVNKYMRQSLETTGDIVWKDAPANVLWSALMHSNNVLSVGYGKPGESFSENKSAALLADKDRIKQIVASTENLAKSKLTTVEDPVLNVMDIEVQTLETVAQLQKTKNIRYLDPIAYGHFQAQLKSNSGCDKNGQNIDSRDYTTIAPGAMKPWNFNIHNIDDAWAYSTGAGITIGVIDTGVSSSQGLLGSRINDGYSNGRSIQKFGTFIDSNWWWSNNIDGPNDKCGHGTSMIATAAAPRNDENMPVGVAYNANVVSYRGTEDVLLNDYHERKGVSNALKELGRNSSVKIISMSIGYTWSIGNVKDAVKYAYSRGKLIFAAGGTSTSYTNWYGVIFPASMDETVAVTGIKDNGYNRCDVCHSGSKIDFTIVMQRASNASRTVPVLGFYNGDRKYVGGSSVATATTAGIAALVWSKNPSWSRNQVLNKLKQASDFYPNRNGSFGYGNIDALQAVQ